MEKDMPFVWVFKALVLIIGSGFVLSTDIKDLGEVISSFIAEFESPQYGFPVIFHGTSEEKTSLLKSLTFSMLKVKLCLEWNQNRFALIINPRKVDWEQFIKIDQQVYFLTREFELYEKYEINSKTVKRKLGQFFSNGTLQRETKLRFVERRSNFQGANLVALVEENKPFCMIHKLDTARYLPDKEVYELLPQIHVQGISIDLLDMLKNTLNFNITFHKRKFPGWGIPVFHSNGSYQLDPGMVNDLVEGKADIVGALSSLALRAQVIDFSRPFGQDDFGIYIPQLIVRQDFDFLAYFRPLNPWTWFWIQMLLAFSCLLLCVFWTRCQKWTSQGMIYLNFFKSQLGAGDYSQIWGKPRKSSSKILILIVLLFGNCSWLAYNAFLTSSLVAPQFWVPFSDFNGLHNSDYRYFS